MKIKRLPNREAAQVVPEVGSKVKSAREECGLSQTELALLLGYKSATAISLMESNKRGIKITTLWKIAQVTNLLVTYFI